MITINEFLKLPKDCEKTLLSIDKKNLYYNLYNYLGKTISYDLETCEKSKKIKSPKEVWKTKKGHCFELSYFLVACLTFLKKEHKLKVKIFYLEQPYLMLNGKWWDHASVLIESRERKIIIDLGRKIFGARYKKYIKLSGEKILGNYYIDCALMIYNKDKIISKKYLLNGLKLYPFSNRGKKLLKSFLS